MAARRRPACVFENPSAVLCIWCTRNTELMSSSEYWHVHQPGDLVANAAFARQADGSLTRLSLPPPLDWTAGSTWLLHIHPLHTRTYLQVPSRIVPAHTPRTYIVRWFLYIRHMPVLATYICVHTIASNSAIHDAMQNSACHEDRVDAHASGAIICYRRYFIPAHGWALTRHVRAAAVKGSQLRRARAAARDSRCLSGACPCCVCTTWRHAAVHYRSCSRHGASSFMLQCIAIFWGRFQARSC